MDSAYCLTLASDGYNINKRISCYHRHVFHGLEHYCGKENDVRFYGPSFTNSYREPIHIWRSGLITPQVFSPEAWTLIVSADVRLALKDFGGVGYGEIVIEHIVSLPMPEIGVLANPPYDNEESVKLGFVSTQMKQLMSRLEDQPDLHVQFSGHRHLLIANHIDVAERFPDSVKLEVNFGSFKLDSPISVLFSMKMLEQFPIYHAGGCVYVLREDFYAALAPFLDLDYYDVAWIDLAPKVVHPWERPEELERRRLFIEEQARKKLSN